MSDKSLTGRRSEEVRGYVNFPVDDPNLPSTNEGGMFVVLVVIDSSSDTVDYYAKRWPVCSSNGASLIYGEVLLGDDVHDEGRLPVPSEDDSAEVWQNWYESSGKRSAEAFHFPDLHDDGAAEQNLSMMGPMSRYLSVDYLAVISLGSTGWSHGDWRCTYDSLTDEGKALYKQVQALYGERGKLYLQTWLDT